MMLSAMCRSMARFSGPPRSYVEIRLLGWHRPVVVASFRSTVIVRMSHSTDPPRPPRVRTLNVPPPLRLPPQPRLDFGRHVRGHAHPAETASMQFTFVRCCGLPPASSPHDLAVRAVAFGSRLLPTRPVKDFHLQSSAHAGHTPPKYPLDLFHWSCRVGGLRPCMNFA